MISSYCGFDVMAPDVGEAGCGIVYCDVDGEGLHEVFLLGRICPASPVCDCCDGCRRCEHREVPDIRLLEDTGEGLVVEW